MLNTNGIRLARDPELVAELASLKPGFDVFTVWFIKSGGFLKNIRGQDMRNIRLQALEQLEKHNISTTLVCVIRKGINDAEIGELIQFAQRYQCVRGITPTRARCRT